jgi:solute carrier family 44 protein 1 (choline transporter-like protein)/choline transporter-like protein 2/4/5
MLVTSGSKVSGSIGNTIASQTNVSFQPNTVFQFLTIYVALGYFWTFNLILAIAQTTTAGAIASWYWTHDKKVQRLKNNLTVIP